MIVFYILCLLYVLSTASAVCDLLSTIPAIYSVKVSNNSIWNLKIFLKISYAECTIASACNWHRDNVFSPFVSPRYSNWMLWRHRPIYLGTHKHCHPFYSPKCPKIYRCWIVWRKNIYVVIVPSFLAITFIGQSVYLHLVKRFQSNPSTSYVGSVRRLRKTTARQSWSFSGCLGMDGDSNIFGRDYGREHPGDGLDRIQDPQGICGS